MQSNFRNLARNQITSSFIGFNCQANFSYVLGLVPSGLRLKPSNLDCAILMRYIHRDRSIHIERERSHWLAHKVARKRESESSSCC